MNLPKENSEVLTIKSMQEVQQWEERDDVEYVERDSKVYLQAETTPYGISMIQALDVTDNFVSNQKVCIIDTGYDRTHPDLAKNEAIVTGASEDAGPWYDDGIGHGTHVAGVISAIGKNGEGITGINRNGLLKLHIVKIFNNAGNFAWSSDLIAAADACVDAGATVINMSLGGPTYSSSEESAFKRIYNEGVLVIAASGNDGTSGFSYPASYSSVISVGAVNKNKHRASFSQYNSEVDLVAPGVDILSTLPGGKYIEYSGTSMAAPHVSGVAALVWSHFPSKGAKDIREALESSAEDLGQTGRDDEYGYGLVNGFRAFQLLSTGCIPGCRDTPLNWNDADGEEFTCAWYAKGKTLIP